MSCNVCVCYDVKVEKVCVCVCVCVCVWCAGDKKVSICGLSVNLSLIARGDELTDNEINAFQRLLQNQYPRLGGCQDTLLGMSMVCCSPERCCPVCMRAIKGVSHMYRRGREK